MLRHCHRQTRTRAHPTVPELSLVVAALASLAACAPDAPPPDPSPDPPLAALAEDELTDDQAAEIAALEALGYLEGDRPATGEDGVLVHDRERAWTGWNLYTSEHTTNVVLMDMSGRVVHEWPVSVRKSNQKTLLRRVRALEDGALLVLIEKHGLVKVDRDGATLWFLKERLHHDFDVAADGTIYALGNKASVFPAYHPEKPILDDQIVVIEPDGTVRDRFSLLEAFERSTEAAALLEPGMYGDVFHSNTLELLEGRLGDRHPAFRAGNLLTCWRELDAIGVLDPEARAVVWTLAGPFRRQHRPSVVEGGRILLFDNLDTARGPEASRVVELELDGTVAWEFHSTRELPFFSETGGACTKLPNGNVLVSETRAGRALEVAPTGEVVWLFVSPGRRGGGRQMARLFELQRLPPDYGRGWLTR